MGKAIHRNTLMLMFNLEAHSYDYSAIVDNIICKCFNY